MTCNDGIACTLDSCNPSTGCQYLPVDTFCDDQDDCTVDTCDPILGCQSSDQGTCPGTPVINEVDYDQPSTDTAEFLEITTAGGAVDLSQYQIELINGANSEIYNIIALDSGLESNKLDAGAYLVLGTQLVVTDLPQGTPSITFSSSSNNLQNGSPDGARIVTSSGGSFVDGVHWEGTMSGVGEGESAGTDSSSVPASLCRCPDGHDTDDNGADFDLLYLPTPGLSNACD